MPRTQNKPRQQDRSYLAPKNERRAKKPKGAGQAQQRTRQEEQHRVTEPLTPKGVRQETRASTNLRFKPLEKAIAGDLRASERRVDDEGDWWQEYLDTVNAGQADTSAAYAQAAQTGQAQIAQSSAIDTANTDRLQGEAAKSAELRGVAPTTAPAEREAAMQAQRNYLASAQGGATAQMGANQRGYLNQQKVIGVGQKIAARKEEQRRGRSIRKDMQDVRKERGDYAATQRGELRGQERDYLIQRQAFGLDKKKANQEAREGAASLAADAGKRAEDRRQQKIDNRFKQRELNEDKNVGKGKDGLTPSEQRTVRNEKQDSKRERNSAASAAVDLYNSYKEAGKAPRSETEWAGLTKLVVEQTGCDYAVAKATVSRLRRKVFHPPLVAP